MSGHDDDHIELPSGVRLSANCGIIGIAPDLDVYEGYDGNLRIERPDGKFVSAREWTHQEKREVAILAIGRWLGYGGVPKGKAREIAKRLFPEE